MSLSDLERLDAFVRKARGNKRRLAKASGVGEATLRPLGRDGETFNPLHDTVLRLVDALDRIERDETIEESETVDVNKSRHTAICTDKPDAVNNVKASGHSCHGCGEES